MDVIAELEQHFRAKLDSMAVELRTEFPEITVSVTSGLAGSLTGYDSYAMHLSCTLHNRKVNEPDSVVLEFAVKHVNANPVFNYADVCWDHPSGFIEDELAGEEMSYSKEVLTLIETGLPHLFASLKEAVRRGKPSNS